MIKWFYPAPRLVKSEHRIKYASMIASKVPFPKSMMTIAAQNERMQDERMYNYHLLLWERNDRDIALRKIEQLQKRLIEVSKELSSLKKKK